MPERIPPTLAELAVPVANLVPYGRNPRRSDLGPIKESLSAHGQYRPIVVRLDTKEVLAGNHTLAAAKELGWTEIAATFVNVDDEAASRIVLADNRTSDLGTYDDAVLLELLRELDASAAGFAGTGYGADELDDLVALLSETEAREPDTSSGDLADGNAWESTGLKEYAERYEEQGRRLIVLDYDRGDYAKVTAGMELLREKTGKDSNAAALLAHLVDLFPGIDFAEE